MVRRMDGKSKKSAYNNLVMSSKEKMEYGVIVRTILNILKCFGYIKCQKIK